MHLCLELVVVEKFGEGPLANEFANVCIPGVYAVVEIAEPDEEVVIKDGCALGIDTRFGDECETGGDVVVVLVAAGDVLRAGVQVRVYGADGGVVDVETDGHPTFVPHRPHDTHRCAVVLYFADSARVAFLDVDVEQICEEILLDYL